MTFSNHYNCYYCCCGCCCCQAPHPGSVEIKFANSFWLMNYVWADKLYGPLCFISRMSYLLHRQHIFYFFYFFL